jgi:tetratricopeptide (TPR) repeat protein
VAAAVTLLALGMTTTVTLVQSRRVVREAELVTRERDKALEVRGFLMEMFGATGADHAVGDSVTARRLLDLQAASLDEAYRDRPELRAEMLEVLADGYDRLGLLDAAEPLAREALALRRRTAGPRHVDVAASLNLLGWILHEKGRSADAEALLREAVAIRRAAGPRYALDLARSLNDLGVVLSPLGHHAEAEGILDEALAIRRSSLGEAHRSVGITASNLAVARFHQGKVEDAIPVQELAVAALLQSVGADHQRSVIALANLAAFRHTLGDWVGAEREYRELLERQIRLRGRMDPLTANVMRSLGVVLHYRAADMTAGSASVDETADALFAEAELHLREALTIFETRLGTSHPDVGRSLEGLRAVLVSRGRLTDALPVQERAVRIFRSAFGDANASTAVALSGLASIHWGLNEPAEAVALQRQALATLEETAGPAHPETAKSRSALCHWLLLGFESASEALPFCAEAERDLRAAPAAYQGSLTLLRLRLAQAHLEEANDAVADSLLAEVATSVNAGDGGDRARRLFDSLTAVLGRRE